MSGLIVKYFVVLFGFVVCLHAEPANNDGKYRPSKTKYNDGKYVPNKNEGRYVPQTWPYVHVHDNRELGRYVHVHIPYGGGYGPYAGDIDKYRYADDGKGSYDFDNRGDYGLYTVSNSDDPFNTQIYDIPKPEVYLEYGFPDHSPKIRKRSILSSPLQSSSLSSSQLPHYYHYLNDNKNTLDHNSFTKILDPIDNLNSYIMKNGKHNNLDKNQNKNVLDSQTTTTTTTTERPRIHYDDEGKWRIIRQEEDKKPNRYDYLYLTENGIYAEEQAKIGGEGNLQADGTSAKGYYEYTGDDGNLYRVDYTVGEQGFVPMGDHIPTPPPIPIEIQRALDYVAKKKANSGSK